MEAMAQTWNDDRIDELSTRVDAGFAQARVDLASTREELRRGIKEQGDELRREGTKGLGHDLRQEMAEMRADMTTRFDSLQAVVAAGQRTMLQICAGLVVALIAALATLISTIV